MILKTLISMLGCVWLWLKLNSAGNRISWTRFVDSCSKPGEMESWVISLQNSHYFINWCITLYILKPWVNVLDWIYALSLIGRTQNRTCLYNTHPIIYIARCSYCWVFLNGLFSGLYREQQNSLFFTPVHLFSITIWHFSVHTWFLLVLWYLGNCTLFAWGGVYSHQESPLVKCPLAVVRTKYNVEFFFYFHIVLFASEPEIVNKTTRVPFIGRKWSSREKQEVQKQAHY